ncbi:hypothetical protein VTO42DRAFT_3615 [Malbranchea cinnamomea]
MANWREEFFAALGVRDEQEKANLDFYEAYTQLADRTARLTSHPTGCSTKISSPVLTAGKQPSKGSEPGVRELQALLSATRNDLSEAQKSREELTKHLTKTTKELEVLKKRYAAEVRKVSDLTAERSQLQLKLRDRDEELRGKAKLLDSVQDELVSINLQFNMAEDRAKKLEKENKELVDRWMARMGQEADAMNIASKFS